MVQREMDKDKRERISVLQANLKVKADADSNLLETYLWWLLGEEVTAKMVECVKIHSAFFFKVDKCKAMMEENRQPESLLAEEKTQSGLGTRGGTRQWWRQWG